MKKPWFGAKRYGYGLSPVSWEGWAVTAVWVAAMAGCARLLAPYGRGWTLGALMLALLVYLVIVGLTSDGKPWRWRWRKDDGTFK